eukprot:sb/3469132/
MYVTGREIGVGVCVGLAVILLLARSTLEQPKQQHIVMSGGVTSRREVVSKSVYKFIFYKEDGAKLSYRAGLKLLKTSQSFRNLVKENVIVNNFAAVFWELPPISGEMGEEQGFEFIVANAPSLSTARTDSRAFESHFNSDTVVTFPNLGRDAVLVAPCPRSSTNPTHLASFLRTAGTEQSNDLLVTIATEAEKWLATRPKEVLWVSTSGLGVYYLHVRLDTRPKYYTHKEYKNPGFRT